MNLNEAKTSVNIIPNYQVTHSSQLYIGLMCGTSIDGVDVALVDFQNDTPLLVASYLHPIQTLVKSKVRSLCQVASQQQTLQQFQHRIELLGEMDNQMGHVFAEAVNQFLALSRFAAKNIIAIGSHGQTIRHQPAIDSPFTLQIGDANIIAQQTGIKTVADFRRMDMAAGGQGAPLAPAFHDKALRSKQQDRIILNLGGIANITLLPADPESAVIGFDTGTANTLMDAWFMRHHVEHVDDFDRNSTFAQTGKLHSDLLAVCLADPYFKQLPPKSTGREYFSIEWLDNHLASLNQSITPQDVQRTLLEFSVISISDAILQLNLKDFEVLTCGGGTHNSYFIQRLADRLNYPVNPTDKVGVNGDYLEAITFAWLAKQRVLELPGNLPSVTGATQRKVLGAIYLA